jgi:hypothetical protein
MIHTRAHFVIELYTYILPDGRRLSVGTDLIKPAVMAARACSVIEDKEQRRLEIGTAIGEVIDKEEIIPRLTRKIDNLLITIREFGMNCDETTLAKESGIALGQLEDETREALRLLREPKGQYQFHSVHAHGDKSPPAQSFSSAAQILTLGWAHEPDPSENIPLDFFPASATYHAIHMLRNLQRREDGIPLLTGFAYLPPRPGQRVLRPLPNLRPVGS